MILLFMLRGLGDSRTPIDITPANIDRRVASGVQQEEKETGLLTEPGSGGKYLCNPRHRVWRDIRTSSSTTIGKRYAWNDELEAPIGITVDSETFKDGSVTLWDRDGMMQVVSSQD